MRPLARPYLQHGNRHRKQGSDPISGIGVDNDWVEASPGAVSIASSGPVSPSLTNVSFSAIEYQTDDGSVYGIVTSGGVDAIKMKQVGSYLVRVIGAYGNGHSGYGMAYGDIFGPVTLYGISAPSVYPLSWSGTGGGVTLWDQLVTVDDLSAPAGAAATVWQSSGSTLDVIVTIQILRLT